MNDPVSSPAPSRSPFRLGFGTSTIPGSAVYTGVARDFTTTIQIIDWTESEIDETLDATIEDAASVRGRNTTSWVNLSGIHDAELVRSIGKSFGLHPLSIEDILNPHHRPKVEHYKRYIYMILKMAYLRKDGTTRIEQLSLVLGTNFVLTFQEDPQDVFDGLRRRIRESLGRIRSRGHDYLAYALMDAVVDNYVHILEAVGGRLEQTESVLDEGDPDKVRALPSLLHGEKRDLMALRKVILPFRDAVGTLVRDENDHIEVNTLPYLRDLHDHLVQLVDSIDVSREMIASLLSLHLALVGQKTNEEMRVLTVIGTIFIPLTFVAGIYGMNFEYMPELRSRWAYPALWVVMIGIAGSLLFYFRRRRWL